MKVSPADFHPSFMNFVLRGLCPTRENRVLIHERRDGVTARAHPKNTHQVQQKVCIFLWNAIDRDITCNLRAAACVVATCDRRTRSRSLDFSPILNGVYTRTRRSRMRWTLTRAAFELNSSFSQGKTHILALDRRFARSAFRESASRRVASRLVSSLRCTCSCRCNFISGESHLFYT